MEKIIVKNELKVSLKQQISALSTDLQHKVNEILKNPEFGELVGFQGKSVSMDEVKLSKVILLWLLKGSLDKKLQSEKILELDKYSEVINFLVGFTNED
jgi:predicted component of type VI protein secretion system